MGASVLILKVLKDKIYKGSFFYSSVFIEDNSEFNMEETRKRYAEYKGIALDSVPSIIPIKGKEELEKVLGAAHEFEHIGEGTLEDLIEFTRENGKIEGTILIHHGGEKDDSYYGVVFSVDANHSDLKDKIKESIPYTDKYKIKLKGTRKEIAEKFKEFIELRKAKESEKIEEQFPRPDYAMSMPFYVSKEKEDSENKYSICFDTCPKNNHGLHARPLVSLINKADEHGKKDEISLIKDGQEAEGIITMMSFGIEKGQNVTVKIKGTDERSWKAAMGIYALFENKFGED